LASDQTAPLRLRQRGFNTLAASADFSGRSLSAFLKERSGDYATGMAAIAGGFVLSALIILAGERAMAPCLVPVELRSSALGSRQPTHHRIWYHSCSRDLSVNPIELWPHRHCGVDQDLFARNETVPTRMFADG
jgi:hypothetical protein